MTRMETRVLDAIEKDGPLRFKEVVDAVIDSGPAKTYLGDALVDNSLDKLMLYGKIERRSNGLYSIIEKGERS